MDIILINGSGCSELIHGIEFNHPLRIQSSVEWWGWVLWVPQHWWISCWVAGVGALSSPIILDIMLSDGSGWLCVTVCLLCLLCFVFCYVSCVCVVCCVLRCAVVVFVVFFYFYIGRVCCLSCFVVVLCCFQWIQRKTKEYDTKQPHVVCLMFLLCVVAFLFSNCFVVLGLFILCWWMRRHSKQHNGCKPQGKQ